MRYNFFVKLRFRIVAAVCILIAALLFRAMIIEANQGFPVREASDSRLAEDDGLREPDPSESWEPDDSESDAVFIVNGKGLERPPLIAEIRPLAPGTVAVRDFGRAAGLAMSNVDFSEMKFDSETRSNIRDGIRYLNRARAEENVDGAVERVMSDSRVRKMMEIYGVNDARAERLLREYLKSGSVSPPDRRRNIEPAEIKPY